MTRNDAIRGFDFHCHIDLHPDPVAIIKQCERERVAVIAVTTTPKAWTRNYTWMNGSSYVHAAVGLHPELVVERFAEIELLEQLIGYSRLVGEIGLDGSARYLHSYTQQKEVFIRALDASQFHGGRIISIHSRRAEQDVIRIIGKRIDPTKVLCILHWFSGSVLEVQHAASIGCYFSVNSAMLNHDHGRTLVQSIPRECLLTETDSPLTEVDKRKSVPWDVTATLERLAEFYNEPASKTKDLVAKNAERVFQFAGIDLRIKTTEI